MLLGRRVEWSSEKNWQLLEERGIGFEEICVAIEGGGLRAIVADKFPKYTHQRILVVFWEGYTYAVPFVENADTIFLKTLYPSRQLHEVYGQKGVNHG